MKMEKIWNSGLGAALVVIALLVAGWTVRLVPWYVLKLCGYVVLGGIIVLGISYVRNRD